MLLDSGGPKGMPGHPEAGLGRRSRAVLSWDMTNLSGGLQRGAMIRDDPPINCIRKHPRRGHCPTTSGTQHRTREQARRCWRNLEAGTNRSFKTTRTRASSSRKDTPPSSLPTFSRWAGPSRKSAGKVCNLVFRVPSPEWADEWLGTEKH